MGRKLSTVSVPSSLTTVSRDDILAGRAIRSLSLADIARATNATLAAGGVLVPNCAPSVTLQDGNAHRFYFRFRPRVQAMERRWLFRIRRTTALSSTVSIAINGGVPQTFSVSSPRASVGSIEVLESLTTQSNSVTAAFVDITPDSDDQVVEGIYCYESPRPSLQDSPTDRGTDTGLLAPELPVVARSLENLSEVLADFDSIGSRPAVFAWSVPTRVSGVVSTAFALPITSASFVAAPGAMPVLERFGSSATRTITLAFYAWNSSGTGGRVRGNSSSNGAGSEVSVTSTSPTWYLASVTVDAEDLDETTGLPGGITDYLSPEVRNISGGTTYVASVAAYL